MDHVALGVPVLILAIAEDLDELLEDGRLTSIAPLREPCRVVVVAIDLAVVFIITVLSAEYGRTHGTSEVLNVIFPIERSNVRASKRAAAGVA